MTAVQPTGARSSRWRLEMTSDDTRKTFVLWLSRDRTAGADRDDTGIEGRLEEVDTGRELRFRSVEQLVSFLQESMRS